MASTACFLHHHAALSTSARTTSNRYSPSLKPAQQLVCRAQKQPENQESDSGAAVSRRLALTVLIGAAAVATKVSPAEAVYGEAGITSILSTLVLFIFVSYRFGNDSVSFIYF